MDFQADLRARHGSCPITQGRFLLHLLFTVGTALTWLPCCPFADVSKWILQLWVHEVPCPPHTGFWTAGEDATGPHSESHPKEGVIYL
jgi:hypothetical protein